MASPRSTSEDIEMKSSFDRSFFDALDKIATAHPSQETARINELKALSLTKPHLIEQVNEDGLTPLLYAINWMIFPAIEVLINHCLANTYAVDNEGCNAFQMAVDTRRNDVDLEAYYQKNEFYIFLVVNMLVQSGLIINDDLIDLTKQNGLTDVAEYLEDLKNKSIIQAKQWLDLDLKKFKITIVEEMGICMSIMTGNLASVINYLNQGFPCDIFPSGLRAKTMALAHGSFDLARFFDIIDKLFSLAFRLNNFDHFKAFLKILDPEVINWKNAEGNTLAQVVLATDRGTESMKAPYLALLTPKVKPLIASHKRAREAEMPDSKHSKQSRVEEKSVTSSASTSISASQAAASLFSFDKSPKDALAKLTPFNLRQ